MMYLIFVNIWTGVQHLKSLFERHSNANTEYTKRESRSQIFLTNHISYLYEL